MNPTTFATITLPSSPLRPNDLRGINRVLNNVYSLFGDDAVLVPVPAAIAGTMGPDCPAITLEHTREVAHQARLTRESIAVACGPSGIHAVFFPTAAVQDDFLRANPRLHGSLITAGPQGTVVWLRCPGITPATTTLPGNPCWLGAGAAVVVAGRGMAEPLYAIVNVAKPIELPFADLTWPEPIRIEMILNNVALGHGDSATQDLRNRPIPNLDFWARCFAQINFVSYDINLGSFIQSFPDQEMQLLPDERVLYLISEFLANYGRQERFAILLKHRRPSFIKEFFTLLKIVTAQSSVPEDELEHFLAASLEPCQGANVSTAELTAAHTKYFRAQGWPPYAVSVFEKRVPAIIERMFRSVRSRKIRRFGKYCRGFNHIRIRDGFT